MLQYYGDKDGLEFSDAVPDMHRSRWKHGDWTDDTDQMILIVDTIINKHKVTIHLKASFTMRCAMVNAA